MNHPDHVYLLKEGIPSAGGVWADLGSGAGAFTLALADLIGPAGQIYSVDKDNGVLRQQERLMQAQFPVVTVHYRQADFTRPLELPPLDGIVMANALHFVKEAQKEAVTRLVKGYLRPGGRLILVEYNVDQGNPWVPYPLSYETWARLARQAGFANVQLLATAPSRFLKQMYSAAAW